jgi:hypothetical protein
MKAVAADIIAAIDSTSVITFTMAPIGSSGSRLQASFDISSNLVKSTVAIDEPGSMSGASERSQIDVTLPASSVAWNCGFVTACAKRNMGFDITADDASVEGFSVDGVAVSSAGLGPCPTS